MCTHALGLGDVKGWVGWGDDKGALGMVNFDVECSIRKCSTRRIVRGWASLEGYLLGTIQYLSVPFITKSCIIIPVLQEMVCLWVEHTKIPAALHQPGKGLEE